MDLQVPPKLISLQSCTELLEARETSGSPDDENTKVTTATTAMHATATALIRTTRVRLSGKCVASMTSFRMLLRLQRTTTAFGSAETYFSRRVRRRGYGASSGAAAAAAAAPNIWLVALHEGSVLPKKQRKCSFIFIQARIRNSQLHHY